jgi:hypothetical protein
MDNFGRKFFRYPDVNVPYPKQRRDEGMRDEGVRDEGGREGVREGCGGIAERRQSSERPGAEAAGKTGKATGAQAAGGTQTGATNVQFEDYH